MKISYVLHIRYLYFQTSVGTLYGMAHSPSPPPFHGYGPEPEFKVKEVSDEPPGLSDDEDEGNTQEAVRKRPGRPKGAKGLKKEDILGRGNVDIHAKGQAETQVGRPGGASSKRLPPGSLSDWKPKDRRTPGAAPRIKPPDATASRPSFYLVGKCPSNLTCRKLPRTVAVLGRFLHLRKSHSKAQAARIATEELINVWLHH